MHQYLVTNIFHIIWLWRVRLFVGNPFYEKKKKKKRSIELNLVMRSMLTHMRASEWVRASFCMYAECILRADDSLCIGNVQAMCSFYIWLIAKNVANGFGQDGKCLWNHCRHLSRSITNGKFQISHLNVGQKNNIFDSWWECSKQKLKINKTISNVMFGGAIIRMT